MKLLPIFLVSLFSHQPTHAEDTNFDKDRTSILAMAGEFQVDFHFHETLSLHQGYKLREKAYDEEAKEIVKIVEDSGRRIILQHILMAGSAVVKHWAQIWTYEDTQILDFQGQRVWQSKTLTAEEAKGKWSQLVTQVDDSPRYEGSASWVHHETLSEWQATAFRPLPRREYTTRKDYDLLAVTNRHTITPRGWSHEEDNTKWVRRSGEEYPLCRETGLNTYVRIQGHDFSKANDYWSKTSAFWKDVRAVWEGFTPKQGKIALPLKTESGSLGEIFDNFVELAEDGKSPTLEEIHTTLKPFAQISENAAHTN
jgi:hypothetical protein